LDLLKLRDLTADTAQSNIRWYGEELTGKTHFGNLSFKAAQIDVQDGVITGGNFIVDMTSLSVEDLIWALVKTKLEGHLRSDDFFSVEKIQRPNLKSLKKPKSKA
jgi:hypothetical protein